MPIFVYVTKSPKYSYESIIGMNSAYFSSAKDNI
jgi:hypothetical protein